MVYSSYLIVLVDLIAGYLAFKSKSSRWADRIIVPPVKNVEEIDILLEKSLDLKINSLFLVLRRLGGGGTIQPKDMVKRAGIHLALNDEKSFIIKVFDGIQHGYIRILNENDKNRILECYSTIATLEESGTLLSADIYERVVMIKLEQSLDIRKMEKSRNALQFFGNVDSFISCERLATSLFPRMISQKRGSVANLAWEKSSKVVVDVLKGNSFGIDSLISANLVDTGILIPVSGIQHEDESTIFRIHESKSIIRIKPPLPGLIHDGGIVIYRVYICKDGSFDIKRIVRLLNLPGNSRDLNVAPHRATRYHSPAAASEAKYKEMCRVFEEEDSESVVKLRKELPVLLAGLSALGCVDTPKTIYNKIIGTLIF
jgi:hypothetical protein